MTKLFGEWIAQNLFNRPIRPVCLILMAPAGGEAQDGPICGPVAGAFKTLRIDKGLQEVDWMTVELLPVMR